MSRIALIAIWCLVLLFFVASMRGQAQDSGTKSGEEIWYGAMDAGPRVFRFVIKTSKSEKGETTAELMSLDEGGSKFKLDDFVIDQTQLRFTLKSTKATYQSQLSDDGKKAIGKWSQGGANLDLVLEKKESVPPDTPDEIWLGTLNVGFQKLDIQVRVYPAKNEKKVAFVDSVSQNVGGFKAEMKDAGNKVTIEVPALKAKHPDPPDSHGAYECIF